MMLAFALTYSLPTI